MPKKKTTMSAAARKRIGDAQKIRWAAYRRAKAAGRAPTKAKRGRGRAAKGRNPYLEMSISGLAECRQQIDAALAEVRRHI